MPSPHTKREKKEKHESSTSTPVAALNAHSAETKRFCHFSPTFKVCCGQPSDTDQGNDQEVQEVDAFCSRWQNKYFYDMLESDLSLNVGLIYLSDEDTMQGSALTPVQRSIKACLEAPPKQVCSEFPRVRPDESEEAHCKRMEDMYHDFALQMHAGMYLTHIDTKGALNDVHCQLTEDLYMLKIDQCTGRIIEFPLAAVSKVLCGFLLNGKFTRTGPCPPQTNEHIVFVAFLRRKLMFVFRVPSQAKCFAAFLDLLVQRAQRAFPRNHSPPALQKMVPWDPDTIEV